MTDVDCVKPPIDEQTLRKAAAGDRDAFSTLFDAHYDFIYRIAYKFSGNQADAEDITQETCVKLARTLHSFRFEAQFTTWLYRLTANTAKDWYRKAYRRQEKPWPEDFDVAHPEPSPERCAVAREILKSVESLPDKLKHAVLLVFRDGLSHSQAANELGCAESTVSWRIHEARKALVSLETKQGEGSHHA